LPFAPPPANDGLATSRDSRFHIKTTSCAIGDHEACSSSKAVHQSSFILRGLYAVPPCENTVVQNDGRSKGELSPLCASSEFNLSLLRRAKLISSSRNLVRSFVRSF
jgi:hypothetical protein